MSQSSGPAATDRTSMGAMTAQQRKAVGQLRPGLVMAGAAFAGLIAGRLTRRLPAGPDRRRARERGRS